MSKPKARKKPAASPSPKEEQPKRKTTVKLNMTVAELIHLRDLMSVSLPTDMSKTVSQALATSEGRDLVETMLWQKVTALCESINIPLGEEAPDFVIALTSVPSMGVFQVSSDPRET